MMSIRESFACAHERYEGVPLRRSRLRFVGGGTLPPSEHETGFAGDFVL